MINFNVVWTGTTDNFNACFLNLKSKVAPGSAEAKFVDLLYATMTNGIMTALQKPAIEVTQPGNTRVNLHCRICDCKFTIEASECSVEVSQEDRNELAHHWIVECPHCKQTVSQNCGIKDRLIPLAKRKNSL